MPRALDQTDTKQTSSEAEWLIDDTTKDLYLSLVVADKRKAPETPAVPERARVASRAPSLDPPKPKKADPKLEIRLSEGPESSSRFLRYSALAVVMAVLAYEGLVHGLGANRQSGRVHHTPAQQANARRNAAPAGSAAEAQTSTASLDAAVAQAGAGSLTMIPGFILASVAPKQSATYTLVINNLTARELTFEAEGLDLVLKDGKPVYLAANETPDSVAGSLLFSTKSVNVKPGQSASLDLTLTLPAQTQVRGVLVTLNGADQIPDGRGASMTPSLGTFISLARSGDTASAAGSSAGASPLHFKVAQWQTDSPEKCSSVAVDSNPLQATAGAAMATATPVGGQ